MYSYSITLWDIRSIYKNTVFDRYDNKLRNLWFKRLSICVVKGTEDE